MFDFILDYLDNEDLIGYPVAENLDCPGYTLESAVEDMLYSLLKDANYTMKLDIIELINALGNGLMSWQEIYDKMAEY